MKISGDITLQELQKQFQAVFPYLNIQFYMKPHETEEGSPAKEQLIVTKTVAEAAGKDIKGQVNLSPDQTIGELERSLERDYGLHAQVFRKSGNLWLQTSTTDHWSLDKANQKGKRSVDQYNEMHNQ